MHPLTAQTTPPRVFISGDLNKFQRGEKIRQFLITETQENRSASRQELLSLLKERHGITMTLARLNTQLRSIGVRQVMQWSAPGSGARQKTPTKYVTRVRDLLRHAVTNGQRHMGTVELSEMLLRDHSLPLVPENLRRHLSAMGFRWMAQDDGLGWGIAGPDYNTRKKRQPRITSSENTIARQIIKSPIVHTSDNARHVCEYVKNRRSKWITENGPCKCGATENLVVYNPGRERIFWTYSDARLLPLLEDASVTCASCMRANINKRRAKTPEEKAAISRGVQAHHASLREQAAITGVAVAREINLVMQLERAQAAVDLHNKRLEDAKLKRHATQYERAQRQAQRIIERRKRAAARAAARKGELFGTFIAAHLSVNPADRKRIGLISEGLAHLYTGEIKTKQIRAFQRQIFATKSRSTYAKTMSILRSVLKCANLKVDLLRLKVGRHLVGKKFIREYMRKARCVDCGFQICGAPKVLRAKDRQPMRSSGLANLPIESIRRRLAETLEVVCQTCLGKSVSQAKGEDASDDEIKDALQSFEQPGQIVKRLSTDLKRVHRLSEELFEIGVTCLCERRLGHGECKELKMIRSSPDYVAPGQSRQEIVIPVAVYNDDRCQGSRSCIFPIASQGLCSQHLAMQQLTESMEGDALDLNDYKVSPFNPDPLLSAVKVEELRNPRLKTVSPSGRWQNTRSM